MNSISANTKWEIGKTKHLSGIRAIDFFDISADGVPDMIVAREDGTVEVYNFETTDEPILKYTYVRLSIQYHILKINNFRMVQKVLQISKVEQLVMQIMMN